MINTKNGIEIEPYSVKRDSALNLTFTGKLF